MSFNLSILKYSLWQNKLKLRLEFIYELVNALFQIVYQHLNLHE